MRRRTKFRVLLSLDANQNKGKNKTPFGTSKIVTIGGGSSCLFLVAETQRQFWRIENESVLSLDKVKFGCIRNYNKIQLVPPALQRETILGVKGSNPPVIEFWRNFCWAIVRRPTVYWIRRRVVFRK